jgi:hypothetical protein
VEYTEAEVSAPDDAKGLTLVAVEAHSETSEVDDLIGTNGSAVFYEADRPIPLVLWRQTPKGHRIDVHLPVLARLSSERTDILDVRKD